MRNKLILSEIKALKTVRLLNEIEDDDEYYKISAKDLIHLFDISGNSTAVTRLPKFKGKKLYVVGSLNLRERKELTDLGNIGYIEGTLDISRTNIVDISNVIVTSSIWDSNSPREKIRLKKELNEKKEIANERRENKEWDINNPNIDSMGEMANALYEYFIDEGEIKTMDEDDIQKYNEIKSKIDELNKKFEEEESSEYLKILNEISELEDELEEIGPKFDVYEIYPSRYKHYGGLQVFDILNTEFENREYTVGTGEEMDRAARDYAESYIDDVGLDGFNDSFLEDFIDEDSVRNMFEEHYEESVRDSPDSYFDSSDYQLTDEQEKRIEELQNYIEELENYIEEKEQEQEDLNDEIEDPQDYRKTYEEIQKSIDEANEKKDNAQEELDGINPIEEPTEEMIEDKISSLIEEDMDNVISRLKDFGMDIKYYINTDKLAERLAESEGWSGLSSYDGRLDEVKVNGDYYYIMRIN